MTVTIYLRVKFFEVLYKADRLLTVQPEYAPARHWQVRRQGFVAHVQGDIFLVRQYQKVE